MKFLLSCNYVLREDAKDSYLLYNKCDLIAYHITYKLYVFLSLFRKNATDIDAVLDTFAKENITITDIIDFLHKEEFKDVLTPSQNNSELFVDFSDDKKLPLNTAHSPERVDFLITKHCNLACKHCFERASSQFQVQRFAEQEIRHFLGQLNGAGIKTLKITGGEPFTHPDIDLILELLAKCNFETMILTNALLLTDERISAIKKAKIQLGISLDGISAETYDYIRGEGNFNTLMQVLPKLSKERIKYSLTCTVNKLNINEIEKITEYAFEVLHAECLFLNRLRPMGRGENNTKLALSDKQNSYVLEFYNSAKLKYGDRIILADDTMLEFGNINKADSILCAAGNTIAAVDEHFDVYPCIYGVGIKKYCKGNLMKSNFGDVWGRKDWNIFRGETHIQQLTDCINCELKEACKIKNCRLKPVFEGRSFYSSVSYCKHMSNIK